MVFLDLVKTEKVPQTEVKAEPKDIRKNLQRVIRFDKFRNIGLDEPQDLVLNSNFEKGRMGNLLVLIGSNNSGKSNVLNGIMKLNDKTIAERDVTDLSYNKKDRNPSISLCYTNSEIDVKYVIDLENNGDWRVKKAPPSLSPLQPPVAAVQISKPTALNELRRIIHLLRKYGYDKNDCPQIKRLQEITDKISADTKYRFVTYKNDIYGIFDWIEKSNPPEIVTVGKEHKILKNTGFWKDNIAVINKLKTVSAYLNREIYEISSFENLFSDYLGVSAVPTVHRYKDNIISGKDLNNTDISNISQSKFFRALFNSFENFNFNDFIAEYKQYNEENPNGAILSRLEKKVNKELNKINNRFNKLYFISNDKYKFTLRLESSRIMFGMARGKNEEPIRLEYQSTGFRWFFDFYFNIIANNNLKPGDIVIMDEPATHMHPQGQAELRKFIKEFAVKNDILFIIATHSPFLIDTDNYDELRVVSMENNRSRIENRFTAVNYWDPDSLLPIKESLTIKQNVLYDLDTEVVWVEGITDYIYLTMFKNLLNRKNIAFLPFNGVGKKEGNENDWNDKREQILKKIIDNKFHRRCLLVDADTAGMGMYNYAVNETKTDFDAIHNLSEINTAGKKEIREIEDLFSSEDRIKYKWIIDNKKTLAASELKIHAKKEDFSKETIANFRKLFKLLQDN